MFSKKECKNDIKVHFVMRSLSAEELERLKECQCSLHGKSKTQIKRIREMIVEDSPIHDFNPFPKRGIGLENEFQP